MRVVIHARTGDGSIDAFARGCQAAGYSVAWQRPSLWYARDYDPKATVLVVHGLHDGGGRVHACYRPKHVPVWIFDLPRRRAELQAIGLYLNDLQWLPSKALRRVHVPAIPTDLAPTVALVCGQKPDDHAHGMNAAQVDAWAKLAVEEARSATGLPVVYRPHPLTPASADPFGADELSDPRRTKMSEELRRSVVMMTHNSTAGWDAIEAGVPVVATDPNSAYREYTTTLAHRAPLAPGRRKEALRRVGSSQWTPEELANPDVIAALFAHHDALVEVVA